MSSHLAPGHTASGIELVGYHDLAGKPGFKLALQVVSGRWYLYVTHFWEPLLSILDVTDPAAIELVGAIEGPDDTATWQVQVADRTIVQGLELRPTSWGGDPARPANEGIRFWDAGDPAHPELLGQWKTGSPDGVHRSHYVGGRYVHVAAARDGFEGNIYVILDIVDPRNPVEVGSWHLPEQEIGNGTGVRISFHGPAYIDGNRAYLGYGAGGLVILDISDLTAPRLVSRLEFGAALSSMIALHTAIPLPGRHLVLVNTEAIAEQQEEPYNFAGIVDVEDETRPRLVSMLPIPVPAPGAPYPNFSKRGGRFGPHNQHHPQGPELFQSDDLLIMTWFNAGLRVYDIRDAYLPREIAWYLPDDPTERRGVLPKQLVTQSEDVLADARGNIFFTDKNHGIHAVRLAAGVGPH